MGVSDRPVPREAIKRLPAQAKLTSAVDLRMARQHCSISVVPERGKPTRTRPMRAQPSAGRAAE